MLWLAQPRLVAGFSVSRRPRLRSTEHPLWLLHLALALFLAQLSVGSVAVVSTPWSAYARKVPRWRYAVGCSLEYHIDMCRFGALQQKPTALLNIRCAVQTFEQKVSLVLRPMLEMIPQGAYVSILWSSAKEVAKVFEDVCTLRDQKLGPVASVSAQSFDSTRWGDLRDHRGAQRFVSHLWATHLAESLPWKPLRAYRFARPNHINVLECHARKDPDDFGSYEQSSRLLSRFTSHFRSYFKGSQLQSPHSTQCFVRTWRFR